MLLRRRVSCPFLRWMPLSCKSVPAFHLLRQKEVYGREKKQQNYYDKGDAYSNLSLSFVGGREKTPQKLRD